MVRYFSQSWLLNCPYKSVNLAEYIINPDNDVYIQDIRYDRNLFDYNQEKFTRKVDISLLDEKTDTPRDWEHFLSSASGRGSPYLSMAYPPISTSVYVKA